MLYVRARAGVSPIHGMGLIAQEFIPAGTRIWQFRSGFDLAMTVEEFRSLSPAAQEQVRHYAWYDEIEGTIILPADDDRFTNHSTEPNTQWNGEFSEALRDIQPGEEITFDYGQLDGTNYLGWPFDSPESK